MEDDQPVNRYPPPAEPYSLKEIVKKITSDPGYANFIHDKVRAARNGDAKAAEVVEAHFEPGTSELMAFGLSSDEATTVKKCTDPRTHLIDFAYYVAYPPP
jgi:hypothetical protein